MHTPKTSAVLALLAACSSASAFDPINGDWSKTDATDLRVMTWNVQDGICSSNDKVNNIGDWNGIVRIIAAMQPDVLILQECGDNSGNGTGGGADNVNTLGQVIELMMHGGPDPFEGGSVEVYVQLFLPDYDLPHVFVSSNSDGFNRNVIMSRYPFADINGGGATLSDFVIGPDAYQSGGTGGIRGFQWAEIDLPDDVYAGDLVIGNAHLKAGGSSSDFADRREASENTAYFIDYYYNGAGTGVSDPNGRVFLPTTGSVLDENTPVIWGGDLNQRPGNGPVEFLTRAQFLGGTDGTDRDRSDSTRDFAVQPVSGETSTQGSNSKLDYLCWQDSIAEARRTFIFRSIGSGMSASNLPFPLDSFPGNPVAASSIASDHRPVLADFILPLAPDTCAADLAEPFGVLNFFDIAAYIGLFNAGDAAADFAEPFGTVNFFDIAEYISQFNAGCP